MKKQKRFSQKGITLVALVITIILLLILAGITISQLTGSGLFENARLAEQKSNEAQQKEDETLTDYQEQINAYISTSNRFDGQSTYRKTVLWTGDATSGSITYQDNHKIDEFDSIQFFYCEDNGEFMLNYQFPVEQLNLAITNNYRMGLYGFSDGKINLSNFTNTGFTIEGRKYYKIVKIYGINY